MKLSWINLGITLKTNLLLKGVLYWPELFVIRMATNYIQKLCYIESYVLPCTNIYTQDYACISQITKGPPAASLFNRVTQRMQKPEKFVAASMRIYWRVYFLSVFYVCVSLSVLHVFFGF